jgi:hypothetical protein
MSKEELVQYAAKGDETAIQSLHKMCFGMVAKKVDNYLQTTNDRAFEYSDFVSKSMEVIWYTAKNLREGIQFNTLYFRCMNNFIMTLGVAGKIMYTHSRNLKNSGSKPEPDAVWNLPPVDDTMKVDYRNIDPDQLPSRDFENNLNLESFSLAEQGFINMLLAGYTIAEVEQVFTFNIKSEV